MTQEEKAKRYDEALEELRGLLEGIREEKCKILEEDITSIFPELKESDDERIKKELIGFLRNIPNSNYTCEEMALWLEKKVEQNPQGKTALETINEEKVDNANKVEPKPTEWSEEDEEIIRTIISDGIRGAKFDMLQIDWLKSIKNRYTWKPSEEQMKTLLSEVKGWKKGCSKQIALESLYNDLKKLK